MKIQLMQCAPRVGDIYGNVSIILQAIKKAAQTHADLLLFPELVLTGYPPEDLLLRPAFMDSVTQATQHIIQQSQTSILVFGAPRLDGSQLKNSAFIAQNGKLIAIYDKQHLPNYGVFDEQRYFVAGDGQQSIFKVDNWRIGISICEDLWHDNLAAQQEKQGCDVWLNLNASPFHLNKQHAREQLTTRRAKQFHCPIVYVNAVGGQDEVVFDGGSHVVDSTGNMSLRSPLFQQDTACFDSAAIAEHPIAEIPEDIAQVHSALVCGVRDYVLRNGSTDVVIGLSGGIDSALTAAIAVEALGATHVLGVLLPSSCSSAHSISDAEALVQNLGIQSITLPIHDSVTAIETTLAPTFKAWNKAAPDVTEENIQARARGILLMAISNKTGRMLLTTGNKSEMAVGYATLYGDMAGGFAVLKDVYKMQVFALCHHLNQQGDVIPQNTIDKPPSAELRPDQKDSDSLPDYAVLDAILQASIEERLSVQDIIAQGYDAQEVKRIIHLLHLAEYKRRQAPPGIKISQRAFGRDRRYPITHAFREE
ncbi:MAG: NAD+ synthase [Mariprofundaceae bacterium]|nr:NAD+ synthase [Mariprofundaceae bacterium]